MGPGTAERGGRDGGGEAAALGRLRPGRVGRALRPGRVGGALRPGREGGAAAAMLFEGEVVGR